ncbi:uncharacterized protein LAJ45_00821 [Morchella importuna]|uniref:Carbohydrate kinase PfkB domain-containing protein n=1 Tax=Morchella conica CCBAS932 TaxID=1392247 RepID=A0A3N4KIA3_9PEZI|nr:uncharacterized protein LAJ45_00821 [Morchella importuna]KAH8155809.1 hypothetical protein LAJ45_00821 [Morchella importuna]RPB10286.1 hypothetical protein P167DRAFT_559776 [Morchella conica CCBAS932]
MSLLLRLPRALRIPRPQTLAPRLYSTTSGEREPWRRFSKFIQVSEEVQQALAEGKPVVALESAIITHGLPYPDNVELAAKVEQTIREAGAIPATTAVIHGIARIGLEASLIDVLGKAGSKNVQKVSRRDLPWITGVDTASGGTTVAGTMILAHHAGIKVFATGGIGGVHRAAANSMDISADLAELGRTPVAVVCSGAKPFLDIERTMEYLETVGVPAITFGKKGEDTFIPLFYSRDSRWKAEMVIETSAEAARIVYAAQEMGLESGQLFMNPIPNSHHINHLAMKDIITGAVTRCRKKGITGKAITPYTLEVIREQTRGASVLANKALVVNNAKRGAEIAVELAALTNGSTWINAASEVYRPKPATDTPEPTVTSKTDVLVVGSIAIDLSCDATTAVQLSTSNPSRIGESLGGVGNNVATAAHYTGAATKLISAVGKDLSGDWALQRIKTKGMDPMGIKLVEGYSTARYVAFNDSDGNMSVASADMAIIENIDHEWLKERIVKARPAWICLDGNLSSETIKMIAGGEPTGVSIAFEPTSVEKAARIIHPRMRLYPRTRISLVSPNELELASIFNAAKEKELFEAEKWFKMIDEIGVDSMFNNEMEMLGHQAGVDFRSTGILQQAVHLAPYFPNQLIKLGSRGVLSVRLVPSEFDISELVPKPVVTRGSGPDKLVVQHFAAEKPSSIVSVNGVGDTFLGVFLGHYSRKREWESAINKAQRAAVLTLASMESVNPDIEAKKKKYGKLQEPVTSINPFTRIGS